MCGIVGLYDPYINREILVNKINKANKIQSHRGPDDSGFYLDQSSNFCHGMTRLAILGLKDGTQPFFSNDKRYSLVFNGEIINFPQLKKHLISKGVQLKTKNSDTEVLLELLILEKESAIKMLNGMFVFSFFDNKEKKLLIARDRFGIKPLYYFNNDKFGFSSEISTILSLYENTLDINEEALMDYMSLMYVLSPNSIYKNINKLKHGHFIRYDLKRKRINIEKWNHHEFCIDQNIKITDIKAKIKEKTVSAVKNWSISEVPISNSLSGGLDSSSISSILGSEKIEVKNFTVGFESNDTSFDETKLANLVSKKYNQEFSNVSLNEDYLIENFDNLIKDTQEPYGGGLPSWFVYQQMSKNYKVGFVGTGIDEFFGNYGHWYNLESFFSFSKNISLKKFENNFFNSRYYLTSNERKKILNFSYNKFESTENKLYQIFSQAKGTIRDKSAILDLETQLPDEFLNICDLFSMSHSLEIRPPFLDNDLTNFLFKIPSHIRTSKKKNDLKFLFRDSMKDLLPIELLNKKKKRFYFACRKMAKK